MKTQIKQKRMVTIPFLKSKPKVSLLALLVFILITVLIGAYLVFRTFAQTTFDIASTSTYTPTGKQIERIYGPDRYSTAVGISKKQFSTTGQTVIISSGETWPDAASGATLARKLNAPILLTQAASLNSYTKNELLRLKPSKVIILGGTYSVSTNTENAIKTTLSGVTVSRLSGGDRYQAAAAIATEIYKLNGNKINDNTAIVVTGANFPDVLSVSSVAAAKGYPVLYAGTTLPAVTKTTLSNMGITRTIVVGGTASIPDTVKNQLPGALRIAGPDRYTASINFVEWARLNLGISLMNLGVASGEVFPDALAAGPYLASLNGPVILSQSEMGSTTYNYLSGKKSMLYNIYVFGGSLTLSSNTYAKLSTLIGQTVDTKVSYLQSLVEARITQCPLLAGTTAAYGDTGGYQAIAYYQSGRIIVNPNHTSDLTRIINHEIYHIYDWRDNGRIDWGESVPRTTPDCIP